MNFVKTEKEQMQSQKRIPINIRVPSSQLSLFDRVAQIEGKSRTDFILDAATEYATNQLLDQAFFNLTEEQWEAFNEVLDAPAQNNFQLAKVMNKKSPWE